jgi:hypothetical protein
MEPCSCAEPWSLAAAQSREGAAVYCSIKLMILPVCHQSDICSGFGLHCSLEQ